MAAPHNSGNAIPRPRAASAFTPALLVSLVAHAAAGVLLAQNWRHATVEPDHALTVKLEIVPPVIVENPPPQIKPPVPIPQKKRVVVSQVQPRAPTPAVIAVERVDPAPPAFSVPVAETPPAPAVVARSPVAVAAPRGDAVEPPHFDVAYLNNPRPAYPPIARKMGIEGVVLLRVDVSAKGTPEKVVVAQTSGASLLDEAAIKAVQGWTFVPARRGDAPIPHPVEVPIRFQLRN